MFRIVWILAFFQGLICTNASFAQYLKVDTTKYVVWDEKRPITWADYPKLASERQGAQALTAVIHSVRGGMTKGKPKFEVYVLFKKKDSWTTNTSDMLLFAHEKLHFDMAEIYGRMVRKQIAAMGLQGVKDLSEYRKAIKYLLSEFKEKSYEYDRETGHGLSQIEQERWQAFVASELQRLNEYKMVFK